jgi:hypothetical protein
MVALFLWDSLASSKQTAHVPGYFPMSLRDNHEPFLSYIEVLHVNSTMAEDLQRVKTAVRCFCLRYRSDLFFPRSD